MKKFKYLLLAISCLISVPALATDPGFARDAKVEIKKRPTPSVIKGEYDILTLRRVYISGNALIYDYLDYNPVSEFNPDEWNEELKAILNRSFCGKPYTKKYVAGVSFEFTIRPNRDKRKEVVKVLSVDTDKDCRAR